MNMKRTDKLLELMQPGVWYTKEELYRALPRSYKGGMTPERATWATINRMARLGKVKKKVTGEKRSEGYVAMFMKEEKE